VVADTPGTSSANATSDKLQTLDTTLAQNGYAAIPYYSVNLACMDRNNNLQNLTQSASAYLAQGIITATPSAAGGCPTTRPGGYTAPGQ
jgi:hypothetical protein